RASAPLNPAPAIWPFDVAGHSTGQATLLEGAQCWANQYHYPQGLAHGTAAEQFAARTPVSSLERADFVARVSLEESPSLASLSARGTPVTPVMRAYLRRQAIRHALVECGELAITRRSIPLPVHLLRCARFS